MTSHTARHALRLSNQFVCLQISHCIVPGCLASLHTSSRAPAKAEAAAKGKEAKADLLKRIELALPQKVKRPERTPEELQAAEKRVKEFSRMSMKAHRQHQREQKERAKLR